MQSKWFSNCKNEGEKREMKVSLLSAGPVLKRLREIVEAKDSAATNCTSADYDCPSWAYKQAHLNGYREAMREIIKYLDTTE